MRAPIIFCHYGKSRYLKYSLECARINNPDKEIVLLGDMTNRRIAQKCGVRHELFARYSHGNEIETFDRVYRLIKGKENRNFIKADRDWIKFVFKRWFFVHNFLKQRGIGPFWHFDSDNMILDSLSSHEAKFRHFDCTEQCNGMCMNGFVSGPAVVSGYINKINELFQRDDYLQARWCVLGFAEADYWTHAAVGGFCSSYSTGETMPSAECRRRRLWKISRYSKIAFASSTRVFHRWRSRSSTCMRLQNDSIIALS